MVASIDRTAARQKPGLTPRERDVLKLAVQGLNRPQIARELDLRPLTIGTHMKSIFRKLKVHNRAGAVAAALRQGLLSGECDNNQRSPRNSTSCPNCGWSAGGSPALFRRDFLAVVNESR
jgi:DNA-binding CsgD family transcriptional regulator